MKNNALLSRLLGSVALVCLFSGQPVAAQDVCDEATVPQPEGCARENAGLAVTMPVGENAELIRGTDGLGDIGFSISVDNETIAGARVSFDPKREADIRMAARSVDLRYDGFLRARLLNVSTSDLRASYRAGEAITFRSSTSYPAFVKRAEIRITDRSKRGNPLVAVLPAPKNGQVSWAMPGDGEGELSYVLRVYDERGRYDETAALELNRSGASLPTHETTRPVVAAGEGEDRARMRMIPRKGGSVTVSGEARPGERVTVMGEEIPVDASGKFVVSRVLPAGDHIVKVNVGGETFVRDVHIPRSEWFYVGIVDLTFGKRKDDLNEADPDWDDSYIDGRLAGYAKGRTDSGYDITVSVDTGEGELKDAFRRLDEKDPRNLLRRLDPEDMYPTYGDDSTAYDDAPTSGRLYLRIEKDGSSATWGDFRSGITGTEFLRQSRGLYGAELKWVAPEVTEAGEAKASVVLYGAQPDTLSQRDILRGSGGSVYFLSRQDINGGSETISVEVVDPDTGRVVSRRTLTEGIDYEIDYIQGVILLSQPLSSSAGGGLISDGSAGSYDVNLIAQYEYTPLMSDVSGNSFGGRAEAWVTDDLRLGVSAMSETTGTADQNMAGVDLHYKFGSRSFIEAEAAYTKGPGFGRAISTDGGLTINRDGVVGAGRAEAWRFDSLIDLADLGLKTPGEFAVYAEGKQAGFSTITEDVTEDQTLIGMRGKIEVSKRLSFALAAESFDRDGGDRKDSGAFEVGYKLREDLLLETGVAYLDKFTVGDADETGKRTDLGARLTWTQSEDLKLWIVGQKTLSMEGGIGDNDRLGVGADYRINEKLSVLGEISGGDKGAGGQAKLRYSPTADNEIYLGYTLDPTRTGAAYDLIGRDKGVLVIGANYRHNERIRTWGENTWDNYGDRRSLARAYGVTYTPDARWTLSGGFETGEVRDRNNGDFDRTAISLGAAYSEEVQKARLRVEYRTEDGDGLAQDRDTWALSGGYEYRVSEDWRLLAGLDALISDSDQASFRDGEYIEASVGYAYRPVANDRLNMLARVTYLRDLPGADQVTADGEDNSPKQVSRVFSIDANYDLTPKLTLGAKYGYRSSKVADRGTDDFSNQTAHLGILRVDWHVVHMWDAMVEVRSLYTEQSKLTEDGALVAVYRHLGNNAKIGLGYEWGRVSDDMTDLNYKARGVFLNVIASF